MLMGHGLGQSLPSMQRSGFFTVDCSSPVTWAFNPACWDNSPAAWAQMNAIATAVGPLPTPHPPTGPSTIQQETIPGAFTPDQAIAGGVQATTQQLQDYFGSASDSLSNMPAGTGGGSATPGSPNWLYVALFVGIGVVATQVLLGIVEGRR